MKLTSPAFKNKGEIPEIHALNYGNKIPEFNCEDAPNNTVSLAMIIDDPDAKKVPKKIGGQGKIWVHYTAWNMVNDAGGMISNAGGMIVPYRDSVEGMTSFQRTGYDGPAPPDKEHTYRFSIFALDTKLGLDPKTTTKTELMKAMKGHILDQDTLLGTFEDPELRKKREAKDKK